MAFDKNKTSVGMKAVIIGFAVILVASLCLPFFSSCSNTGGADQDAGSSSSTDAAQDTYTVADVQAQYATLLDSLKERRKANPDNLTYVVNLGNNYMDCAISMRSAGDAEQSAATVKETFEQAVAYYDEYLAAEGTDESVTEGNVSVATVNRAVCLFYADEAEQAIADLEAFLEKTPDYAMGWYNLGVMYGQQGDTEKAKEAYNTAIEKDADGSAGANLPSQIALQLLENAEEEDADDAASSSGDDSASDDSAADDGATDGGAAGDSAADNGASDDAAAGNAAGDSASDGDAADGSSADGSAADDAAPADAEDAGSDQSGEAANPGEATEIDPNAAN